MAVTEHMKNLMREAYEVNGDAFAKIGRDFGISAATVSRYAKDGGWVKPDEQPAAPEPEPGSSAEAAIMSDELPNLPTSEEMIADGYHFIDGVADPAEAPPAPSPVDDAVLAAALADIDRLEREKLELEAKIEKLQDVKKIKLYETEGQVVDVLGVDHLRKVALNRLYMENRRNVARYGHAPVNYEAAEYAHIVNQEIEAIVGELLRERTSHIKPDKNLRVMKMVNPHTGAIMQIAMEEQINNMKGEATAPMAKMRAKGWQIAEPYLCQLLDCWLPAKRNEISQEMEFNGYCSAQHRARDPYLNAKQVPNVTTTAHIGQRGY